MAGGRQETGIGQRGNTRGTRGVGSSVEIFCLLFYFFPSHFPFVVRTIGPIGRIPRSCTPCLRRRTHDMYVRELRIIDTYQPYKDIHDYYLKRCLNRPFSNGTRGFDTWAAMQVFTLASYMSRPKSCVMSVRRVAGDNPEAPSAIFTPARHVGDGIDLALGESMEVPFLLTCSHITD
ncbi:hypothetical protein K456DRAFT_630785 [Colletotrichum gloeosporioides 23]|nr:hypothetical protein K456DRAFT_630785 [Colletotrichum gloeosporioides 23]